jgi:hypothetical protein
MANDSLEEMQPPNQVALETAFTLTHRRNNHGPMPEVSAVVK